jgi:RNA polymerase sigma-70 factor, ECF subfamily
MDESASIPGTVPTVNAASFEAFFESEYGRLCEALVFLTGDPFEAEEIAQDAMTRVLERWDRVNAMASPTGYLFRTAMNLNRNRIRSIRARARRRFHELPVPDHGAAVVDQLEVRRALDELSRSERAALILVDWQRMDAAEAGAVLGISPGAVRVRLHRARAAFERSLGGASDG